MINNSTEYIARISYGKDSLKMLDVIHSRGLPLDRITTTDVWATDTISANLPPVEEFKARMDERIFQLYGIKVEHLCARNPDGSKKTYEQMFYHVPVRRSQTLNVEREREKHQQGTILGFPDLWNPWCQAGLKRTPNAPGARYNHRIPTKHPVQLVSETQNTIRGRVSTDFRHYGFRGAGAASKSTCDKPPFLLSAALQRAKTEILWNTLALLPMNPSVSAS